LNGTDRIERELTTWFADTAAPRVPDYTADILGATATIRQRPRWSFPARWLPAAVVPRLPRLTQRPVPWRTIALLALLGLLLAATLTLYIGSRPRVPAPFGPAANGLVAYAELGGIWTVDPVTGVRQKIVSLTGSNDAPRFSRDGTRLAFLRKVVGGQSLAMTRADGSQIVLSKSVPFVEADTDSIAWSPDGRMVAVVADGGTGRTTYLVDTTTGEVRDLDTPGVDVEAYWRPPDGHQLMYMRSTAGRLQPVLVSVADGPRSERPIGDPERDLRPGGWTPDGG
jgi:WD40 repeat protein